MSHIEKLYAWIAAEKEKGLVALHVDPAGPVTEERAEAIYRVLTGPSEDISDQEL